jgi:hypothetical protein
MCQGGSGDSATARLDAMIGGGAGLAPQIREMAGINHALAQRALPREVLIEAENRAKEFGL